MGAEGSDEDDSELCAADTAGRRQGSKNAARGRMKLAAMNLLAGAICMVEPPRCLPEVIHRQA
jgi:hypothetical protein